MRLSDAPEQPISFRAPAIPDLRYLRSAVQKVHHTWPDLMAPKDSMKREELAQRLMNRISEGNWTGVPRRWVSEEAAAIFDRERRGRADLAPARELIYQQTRWSCSKRFLREMLMVYMTTFDIDAGHSRQLGESLKSARAQMGENEERLMSQIPELFDYTRGPSILASRMCNMNAPFQDLIDLGLRYPHDTGFMDHAHESFANLVQGNLTDFSEIERFLSWVRPPGRVAREAGVKWTIGALVYPWMEQDQDPPDGIRTYLVDTLIEMYGDPRKPIQRSGVWASVEEEHMNEIFRWLTREDMKFFIGVVDVAQKDPMWGKRKIFWEKLYNKKKISVSWVAFSTWATWFAHSDLMRKESQGTQKRFGWQCARENTQATIRRIMNRDPNLYRDPPRNTSLLIMRIEDKIVVEGCHNYMTHIFHMDDPMAPKLSLDGYDCEEIRIRSAASMSHSHIPTWERWVEETIARTVGSSTIEVKYSEVVRPPELDALCGPGDVSSTDDYG